jgi:hypothetical protein
MIHGEHLMIVSLLAFVCMCACVLLCTRVYVCVLSCARVCVRKQVYNTIPNIFSVIALTVLYYI